MTARKTPAGMVVMVSLLLLTSGCGAVRSVRPRQTDTQEPQTLLRRYYQCAEAYGQDREQLKARCEPYITALKNWRAANRKPADAKLQNGRRQLDER